MIAQIKTMKIKNMATKWLYIPGHPFRILIIGGSGSGKTNENIVQLNERTR